MSTLDDLVMAFIALRSQQGIVLLRHKPDPLPPSAVVPPSDTLSLFSSPADSHDEAVSIPVRSGTPRSFKLADDRTPTSDRSAVRQTLNPLLHVTHGAQRYSASITRPMKLASLQSQRWFGSSSFLPSGISSTFTVAPLLQGTDEAQPSVLARPSVPYSWRRELELSEGDAGGLLAARRVSLRGIALSPEQKKGRGDRIKFGAVMSQAKMRRASDDPE